MFICLNAKMLKCNKSFTLIEILVSITIFTFLIMAALGIYITAITKHRQALRSQVVNEDLNYATEVIYRDIKDSYLKAYCEGAFCGNEKTIYLDHPTKKIVGADCDALAGPNKDCDDCSLTDTFSCRCCLQYRLNSATHKIEVKGAGDFDFLPLTSSRVNIEDVNFLIPTGAGDTQDQPRITILIEARERNDTLGTSRIILEMTVTQNEVINFYIGNI